MHNQKLFLLPVAVLTAGLVFFSGNIKTLAGEFSAYFSPSGLYQLKMPEDRTTDHQTLRVSPDTVVNTEKNVATVDQRPYKKAVKNYVVQLDQTLGHRLSTEEISGMIDRDIDRFIAHYRNRKALLKKRDRKYYDRHAGGEVYMTYFDDELGMQAVRARILFTPSARLQQVVIGPDRTAFSIRSENFFNSLHLKEGNTRSEGTFEDNWESHTSPLKIFSVLVPPKIAPYHPEAPAIQHTKKSERMEFTLVDPVRGHKVFYRTYGYKTDEPMTFKAAQNMLLGKHVARYLKVPRGLRFNRGKTEKGYPVLETSFFVSTPKDHPAANAIKLRATFLQNYMFVQELVTSKAIMNSKLSGYLMDHALFHPEQAHAHAAQPINKEEEAEPVAEEELEFAE